MKTLYILLIAIALTGCSTNKRVIKSYRNHFYYINRYGFMLDNKDITFENYVSLVKGELELMRMDSIVLKR